MSDMCRIASILYGLAFEEVETDEKEAKRLELSNCWKSSVLTRGKVGKQVGLLKLARVLCLCTKVGPRQGQQHTKQ